jgi:hypothetical protein
VSWSQWHSKSERLASEAEMALRRNETSIADDLYLQAAEAENQALVESTSLYTSLTGRRPKLKNSFTFKDLPQPL